MEEDADLMKGVAADLRTLKRLLEGAPPLAEAWNLTTNDAFEASAASPPEAAAPAPTPPEPPVVLPEFEGPDAELLRQLAEVRRCRLTSA